MALLGLTSYENWIIFLLYIIVSINHAILTTASQDGKKYKFDATSAVLLAEILKLATACALFIFWDKNSFRNLLYEVSSHKKVMALYSIPAFLYSLSNNLSFINLSLHDPTTFIIMMQLRIVLTGVIYQILFQKKLSWLQWISLIVLTCGCIIKHLDFSAEEDTITSIYNFPFTIGLVFLLLQSCMALFAGIYTEYLLKGKKEDVNIWIQNIYMYVHSIFWNFVFAVVAANFLDDHFWKTEESIFQPKVLAIVFNYLCFGIVTSIFLKMLNSIVKSFAIAIEMVLMPVLGHFLFGVPVSVSTVLSIVLVIIAVQIYSRNPVSNQPSLPRTRKDSN
ncbi:UDP-galactose transporter senju-like [Apostichopus japonicus]|uniref:UDP-galactose transporter senju-like n=1 Tax=Stichopus japonicus TaxID=307972 RepID=UPI003AB458B7